MLDAGGKRHFRSFFYFRQIVAHIAVHIPAAGLRLEHAALRHWTRTKQNAHSNGNQLAVNNGLMPSLSMHAPLQSHSRQFWGQQTNCKAVGAGALQRDERGMAERLQVHKALGQEICLLECCTFPSHFLSLAAAAALLLALAARCLVLSRLHL